MSLKIKELIEYQENEIVIKERELEEEKKRWFKKKADEDYIAFLEKYILLNKKILEEMKNETQTS